MNQQQDDSTTPAPDQGRETVRLWLSEIADARRREKRYRAEGKSAIELYEAGKKVEYQFNILYSNTETLAPALYNVVPRPVVQRRFKDEDKIGKLASQLTQRTLEFLIDSGDAEYEDFDDLMKHSVLSGLVPGRGLVRFKYEADIEQEEAPESEGGLEVSGAEAADQAVPGERIKYETVCGEKVEWDHFLHGYARSWKKVPWIAFEWQMSREELVENFGEIGRKVPVTECADESKDDQARSIFGSRYADNAAKGQKMACVYEIWDKVRRKVLFISPAFDEGLLKPAVADPLGLSGFYPIPKPLQFFARVQDLMPLTLYSTYEEQAKELNRVTTRINRLIAACKIRGMYDSAVEGLDRVIKAGDNELIAAENVATVTSQGGKLADAIWLMPITDIINALQQLYLFRNQVKQVIYEITGIADIMRGSSNANETLGAQEIKNQWGTLRLKRMQKEVMRYSRDCLRIMAELAVTKLAPQTLKAMTGLPIPTEQEKQVAAQQIAQAEQMQQPPDPGAALVMQSPSLEAVQKLLQNDLLRQYRIDIETNSTVDTEATEDKQNISELLNALAQFLNGVAPLVEQGSMPFDAAKAIMLTIVRRFRFGTDVEDALQGMSAPKPKDDGKAQAEQAKAQMEAQKGQMEMQVAQQKAQQDQQLAQMDMQLKQQQLQLDQQRIQLEMQQAAQEHAFKMEEMRMKAEQTLLAHQTKMAQLKAPKPKTAGSTPA